MAKTEIETVGIRAFGDSVSAFIRKASLGVRVLISDRGKVVAELHQPGASLPEIGGNEVLKSWEREGLVRLGKQSKFRFPRGEKVLKDLNIQKILDELRG